MSSNSSVIRRSGPCLNWRRLHFWAGVCGFLPLFLTVSSGMLYRIARSMGAEKTQVKWLMQVHTLSIIGLSWVYPLLLFTVVLALVLTGFRLSYLYELLTGFCCCSSRWKRSGSRNLHSEVERFEARRAAAAEGRPAEAAEESEMDDEEEEAESENESVESILNNSSFLSRRVPNPQRWTAWQFFHSLLPKTFTWRWLHRLCGMVLFVPFAITATTGALYIIAEQWLYLEKAEYKSYMYYHEGRYIESSGTVYVTIVGGGILTLIIAGGMILLQRFGWTSTSSSSGIRYASVASSAPQGGGGASGSSSATSGSASGGASSNSPSASTLARIHRAFDIDHLHADETEDEGSVTPAHQ